MAPLWRGRDRRRSVTASAVHVDARRNAKNPGKRGADTSWQERAWSLFDELGEIHYAADFFGKNLAKLRLLVQQQNEKGEWEEISAGDAVKALERIQGPEGGREALQGQYGRLSFMVGEMYLFVSRPEEAAAEQWEILSVEEIQVPKSGDGYERRSRTSGATPVTFRQAQGEELQPGEAQAYRLWQPHPRRSSEADSPMRAVIDVCEELQILSRAVRGRARSRAAGAGLLLLPNEISPAPPKTIGDEDPAEDPFMADLAEALVTPIADEESAAAVVPMLVRGPATALKELRHVSLSADAEHGYPEQTLRAELIRRMAQGLDLPVEVLLGFAGANHWSGWLVDDQTWGTHLQPKAEALCSDLTAVYLRQTITQTPERFRIWYDAAAIVNRPDRSRDAKDLHDRGELTGAALRDAAGFDETDAPDDAERRRWVGVTLGDVGLATGGEPTSTGTPADQPAVEPGGGSGDTEKAPPETEAARLLGAAEAAFWRCRQAAGSRLLTRLQREPELRSQVRGVDTGDVAHVLGQAELERLGQGREGLVAGGAECLHATTGRAGGGQLLCAAVERWAAETVYESTADLTASGTLRPPLEVRQLAARLARRR